MFRTLMVAVLLAGLSLDAQAECVGDANHDLNVSLGEVQQCVGNYLAGCISPMSHVVEGWPCGNGVLDAGEDCDFGTLNGRSCASLGFLSGDLACGASCMFDSSGCVGPTVTPTATATATPTPTLGANDCCDAGFLCGPPSAANCAIGVPVYGAFCDGGAGRCMSFTPTPTFTITPVSRFHLVDNGDGTITDARTGLIWEKKVGGAGIHDQDARFTWADAFDAFIVALNVGDGFANHTDWRLPTVQELQTIIDYGDRNPAIDLAFNGLSCGPTCTDVRSAACSCTPSDYYWSATTVASFPSYAWVVNFNNGDVFNGTKSSSYAVRAVRGGL